MDRRLFLLSGAMGLVASAVPALAAGAVITLKRVNGTAFAVSVPRIARIRAWAPSDDLPAGTVRVDWLATDYVTGSLDEIIAKVLPIVPTFKSLTSPIGAPIWFDARSAIGPLPVLDKEVDATKVHSAIRIGGHMQYLGSTSDEVIACISGAGGEALVPGSATLHSAAASARKLAVWKV